MATVTCPRCLRTLLDATEAHVCRTPAQRQRQERQHRTRGRYAKVNPCYVCGKSAGLNYWSHPDTDRGIADALLVLCTACMRACQELPGEAAVAWAERMHPTTYRFARGEKEK